MCTLKMNLKWFRSLALVALFGMVYSTSAMAVGTSAGTPINNSATVGYNVGGVPQTAVPSNTTSFVVDQVVDLTVAEADGGNTIVGAGQLDAVARFTVTNTGNATQDFALSIADLLTGSVFGNPDTINADALTIVIDANGNDVYDAGADTVAPFIDALVADGTVSVFILGDIPTPAAAGAAANIELTATAHQTGTAGVLDPPRPKLALTTIRVRSRSCSPTTRARIRTATSSVLPRSES